ncbi:hypothetical protein LUI11_36830 [Bradyrhizobium diazoefficiens]|uniref:hypothetical protein n=1 Tax=Bradyrhizobium TaxID=374 RepID=UPI000456FEF3|nr:MULTISPECIES: hypothetical protein [Bradyrhizobium]APO52347.1 hypothetical protein BD122_18785 [Bradyrhizobium diazoefficiens]MCD9298249.1 hypothetical protein [Bradyrhizobium diazoefficiens]MCD9815440.1 hypothetical protein [Bradyrhizobium diazoefficiens]MCD9833419.1 hypothetical protein [Bradyrhizobium diazoefficiens]MCD9851981.1 hypothetical protein [Bradyrhizobium diazoefficiens]
MGRLAKRAVSLLLILALPLALAACFGSDGDRPTLMDGTQAGGPQPFPDNFRGDTLALMRAYLNNPVGVREASMAEPVLRELGGRQFYVSCLRFTPRETDGSYKGMRERAVVFVNGRADRVLDRASELCTGAVYAPFPELEKMMR